MRNLKEVAGYPYEVSDDGLVRRSIHGAGKGATPGKLIKIWINVTTGYPMVTLYINNQKKHMTVHRLVATAFLPPPLPHQPEVAHNDGTKENNIASNLRWASHQENMLDRNNHGTSNHGSRNGMSKLSEEEVFVIRAFRRSGWTQKETGDLFGVSRALVSDIWKGRRWGHLFLP